MVTNDSEALMRNIIILLGTGCDRLVIGDKKFIVLSSVKNKTGEKKLFESFG